jgi:hypothetical protein
VVVYEYTDNLREEAMKGWAEKLAQGWLPAEPPPGYKTITHEGKKIHVVNPEIYRCMPRIFKLALLPGYTRRKLSEEMAMVGITTKNGRPFAISQVTAILTNPFYIGINRMQGKEYPGAQEPIITKRLFYEVQRKLKSTHSEGGFRKHDPVFKRMMRCDNCGTMITWSKQKGRYYGACQRRRTGCWGAKYLREDRVEMIVIQQIEGLEDLRGKTLAKLKAALQLTQPQDVGMYRQKMIEELSRQLQRMTRMEENLYDDRLAGFISRERYEEKRRRLTKQAVEVAERLAMLREAQDTSEPLTQEPRSDNPMVDLYLRGTPHQKRIFLSTLFKKITVKEGQVSFILAKG